MNSSHLETLQNEATRLLQLESKILTDLINSEGILSEPKAGEKQSFDKQNTPHNIEVLKGELHKLEKLEMVVAVVGTMKAGKSTTINAIVGSEVLPNRNRPMTAIPTLIQHTKGQTQPLLEFKHKAPIETLMRALNKEIANPKNQKKIQELEKEKDLQRLIQHLKIVDNCKCANQYSGPDEIFNFLRILNDLVRLSNDLGIEFPFHEYDEIHEIPVIKVEFAHLSGSNNSTGTLTLLDTPGPNESGQPHLRKMLKDQLSKASAVLAVMDFTQLKSEADAQMREDLKDIINVSGNRLYAIVNKFDQRDRNGDTEDEVKSYVSNNLMGNAIPEKNVFPVSSRLAYLANRVIREIEVNHKIPSAQSAEWVEDFAKEAFGASFEDSELEEIEEVSRSANKLWKKSKFSTPLENVILAAQKNAAWYAIESSASKTENIAERLENFLNIRETSLLKSTQDLQKEIASIQADIQKIEVCEVNANTQAKKTIAELESSIKNSFNHSKKQLNQILTDYFATGKKQEQESAQRKQEAENEDKKNKSGGFFCVLLGTSGSKNTKLDFDATSEILKFNEKSEAQNLLNSISETVTSLIDETEKTMKKSIVTAVDSFEDKFINTVKIEAEEIVNNLLKRLSKDGFSIHLKIPNADRLKISAGGANLLSDAIENKSKTVTKSRRQKGAWGTVCKWFGTDDWGWEEYNVTETYFEVNMPKIKNSVTTDVEVIFNDLEKAVTEKIKQPIQENINEFFSSFKNTVEEIQGDLLEGMRNKEKSKADQEKISNALNNLKKNLKNAKSDSLKLLQELKTEFQS